MSLIRSDRIDDLKGLFNPPLCNDKVTLQSCKTVPFAFPAVAERGEKRWNDTTQRKRKRTGNPDVDGLVGVERNPGPDGISAFFPDVVQAGAWGALKNTLTDDGVVFPEVVDRASRLNSQFSLLDTMDDMQRWWRGSAPRPRTGNPYNDGLIGVEPNPGPNKSKGMKRLKREIKKEKRIVQKAIQLPRAGKKKNRRIKAAQVQDSVAPVNVGSTTNYNYFSTGATDSLIADCAKVGGINVKGRCYTNLSIGTSEQAASGDYPGMFLDGAPYAPSGPHISYIPFNFQDLDDRVQNLAETYQWFRVRSLTPLYVPMVATTAQGQWAFSVMDNFDPISTHTPTTINSLLTANISCAGSLWVPTRMPTYKYNSAKVWSCPTLSTVTGTSELSDQLCYLARVFLVAGQGVAQFGKIMFEYSIDFFEPRGNVGTVTLDKPSNMLLRDLLSYDERRDIRIGRSLVTDVLKRKFLDLIGRYERKCGKDEEGKECDSPFVMEQNPLTQSIHIPKNIVERLAQTFSGDVVRRA